MSFAAPKLDGAYLLIHLSVSPPLSALSYFILHATHKLLLSEIALPALVGDTWQIRLTNVIFLMEALVGALRPLRTDVQQTQSVVLLSTGLME